MKIAFKTLNSIVLFAIFFSFIPKIAAQRSLPDSLSNAKMEKDTLVSQFINRVESYNVKLKQESTTLKRKIQITPISSALPDIQKNIISITKRLDNKGKKMNLRGLNTSGIMQQQIIDKLSGFQKSLEDFYGTLDGNNVTLKEIRKDHLLKLQVSDIGLNEQLKKLIRRVNNLDSVQKSSLENVTLLKNKVSVLLLQAKDNNSEIGYLTISMKNDMWGNENIPLLQDETDSWDKTITEMFTRAFRISGIVLAVYLVNSWQNALPAILMLVFLLFWSYANLRRIKSNVKSEEILGPIFFLKDSVLAGCLVLFFSFLPFFFRDPQMALLHLCEFLRLLALSYLIFPYLSKKFKPLWILLCIIWIYFALDDLLLEESYVERWLLMIFDVALIYLCTIVFRNTQKIFQKVSNSPATKLLTIFSLSLTSLSIILNLTGRVTLAKMFGIASIQSLVVGVTIKVICKVILEFIYLQAEAYQDSRLSLFINFKVLEIKLGKVLWFFAVLFWFAALLVDFDLFTSTLDIIIDFLDKSRSIGNMNFTYNNVFVFVGIIYLSSLLSAFVNFFFGHEISKNPTKKSNIGSILLLIRLAIWALGFVIAVAAAGIPIDKISILLGALGVGIGFGLQHITNNLVSGIVLAFERPIQIGDQIEVSGKIGVVNEIGVRSSKIKSVDGSDIIIPNGDLLSQHLINWTQQNRNKRMNFVIGISYDSNLLSVTEIIKTTLENNEDVLETPAPAVLVQNFAASAIEISIYFWVADLFKAPGIKSKVMIDVFDTLGKNNIQIPFPIVTVIQENKTEE